VGVRKKDIGFEAVERGSWFSRVEKKLMTVATSKKMKSGHGGRGE